VSERATNLHRAANRQIGELLQLLSTRDAHALGLPCPRREKLGDGTIGATAQHVLDVYHRLARFIDAQRAAPRAPPPSPHDAHTHAPSAQGDRARLHPEELLQQLSATASALGSLAELTDEQLNTIPPAGSFRFCDGRRTLEQVIASVLNHQDHHIAALMAATPEAES
jgi:hypothetical protein